MTLGILQSTVIVMLYEKYQKPGDIKIFMLKGNIGRQRKKRRMEEKGRKGGTKKRQEERWGGKGLGEEGRLDFKHSLSLSLFFFPKNVTGSLCAR